MVEWIHSDQGRNFESSLIQQLCSLYNVEKSRTAPGISEGCFAVEAYCGLLCPAVKPQFLYLWMSLMTLIAVLVLVKCV
ncbi:hypothetical protein QQF64_004551 [Cirrhinus molitorella]|uniref:Integrase catalytic domain-containing protein n=1 Tax=Cirrhinus molitorella TaxID=172907 RepID=A0ABR3MIP5_9TELE